MRYCANNNILILFTGIRSPFARPTKFQRNDFDRTKGPGTRGTGKRMKWNGSGINGIFNFFHPFVVSHERNSQRWMKVDPLGWHRESRGFEERENFIQSPCTRARATFRELELMKKEKNEKCFVFNFRRLIRQILKVAYDRNGNATMSTYLLKPNRCQTTKAPYTRWISLGIFNSTRLTRLCGRSSLGRR